MSTNGFPFGTGHDGVLSFPQKNTADPTHADASVSGCTQCQHASMRIPPTHNHAGTSTHPPTPFPIALPPLDSHHTSSDIFSQSAHIARHSMTTADCDRTSQRTTGQHACVAGKTEQSQSITWIHFFFFQNGAASGLETCFAIGSQHLSNDGIQYKDA